MLVKECTRCETALAELFAEMEISLAMMNGTACGPPRLKRGGDKKSVSARRSRTSVKKDKDGN